MAALATQKFWHGAPVDYFCRFYCARLRLDEWKLNIWKISIKPAQVIIIASPMYYIIIIIFALSMQWTNRTKCFVFIYQ